MKERKINFYQIKRITNALNLIAGIAALWTFFFPYPYRAAILSALAMPILALIVFKRYRGSVQLDEHKKNVSPSVFWAFFYPTMALLIRSLDDYTIFDFSGVWSLVWPLSIGMVGIILIGQPEFRLSKRENLLPVLAMFILAFSYVFSALIISNCAFDKGNAAGFETQILHKRSSSTKNTTYYFELAPWGPEPKVEEFQVNSKLYEQKKIGDSVEVLFMEGQWGIPWYLVRP